MAELVGTTMLLIGVVGSGKLADRLSPENAGVALLAHALAVAGVLGAAILVLGPVSGAHLNPAVSLAVLVGRGSAGIYFTSSNFFANPAVTVARTLTDTFTGIAPVDAAVFLPVELVAAVLATLLARYVFHDPLPAEDVVVPHEHEVETA